MSQEQRNEAALGAAANTRLIDAYQRYSQADADHQRGLADNLLEGSDLSGKMSLNEMMSLIREAGSDDRNTLQ